MPQQTSNKTKKKCLNRNKVKSNKKIKSTFKNNNSNDNGLNSMFNKMLDRDPRKRQVKPKLDNQHFDLLNMDLVDTSSDDEDYKPGKRIDDEDDDLEEEDDDDDDVEEEEDDDEEEYADDVNRRNVETKCLIKNKSFGSESIKKEDLNANTNFIEKTNLPAKVPKLLVCSVCLGEVSHCNDEIVECDSCGITVHEGCYGITGDISDIDNESIHSNASSSSTEPWFCDACKANVSSPVCELCPNLFGIFKQSEVNRWVHLVCALYIPGVAFADTTHLRGLTLFELPYNQWGLRACSLCEDERLTRTGVTICCDAGMCKTYFHVTCAQSHGLLCEAQTADETELVDPFYGHCKLHALDKSDVKKKRRNFLALQSKMKNRLLNATSPSSSSSNTTAAAPPQLSTTLPGQRNNERINKKLEKAREKWRKSLLNRPAPWIPTQKIPRMLTTCPSAVRKLIRKSELLGLSPQAQYLQAHDIDIRRKWHVPPSFTVDFVSYYLDRNNRMQSMQKRLEELKSQSKQLKLTEDSVRSDYERIFCDYEQLNNERNSYYFQATQLWLALGKLTNKAIKLPKIIDDQKLIVNESSKERKPVISSSLNSSSTASSSIPHLLPSSSCSPLSSINNQETLMNHLDSVVLKTCGHCNKTKDQHQLALCDSCQINFHLYCLDPPLTRMPKKTRFGGWQCSTCTEKDDECFTENNDLNEDGDEHLNNANSIDAPRKTRLRKNVKSPKKFIPDEDVDTNTLNHSGRSSKTIGQKKKRKKKRKKVTQVNKNNFVNDNQLINCNEDNNNDIENLRKNKQISPKNDSSTNLNKTITNGSSLIYSITISENNATKKTVKNEDICCRCAKNSLIRLMVQCDECLKYYHFSCLQPPVKKSPKQRGYKWFCEDCDESDEEESEMNSDEEDEEDDDEDEEDENDSAAEEEDDDDEEDCEVKQPLKAAQDIYDFQDDNDSMDASEEDE